MLNRALAREVLSFYEFARERHYPLAEDMTDGRAPQ